MTVPRIFATQAAGNVPASYLDEDFVDVQNPTATGSTTARTLQARFAEVFNALDYGLVVNAVTDNTAALQATINAAQTYIAAGSNVGAIVQLPMGAFLVNSAVTVSSDGVIIRGYGPNATFVASSTGADVFIFSKGGSLQQEVGLQDLRVYGTDATPTAGSRLKLVNVGASFFQNLSLEHGFQGLVMEGGTGNSFINVNAFTGQYWLSRRTGSSALYITSSGSQPSAGSSFVNCNFQGSGTNAFLDDALLLESCDGVFFANCHFGFAGQSAVRMKPAAGTVGLGGPVFANCGFDGFFGGQCVNGIVIENPNSNSGTFGNMDFTGCGMFGNFTDAAFYIKSDATALSGLSWVGGRIGFATAIANIRISAGSNIVMAPASIVSGPTGAPGVLIDGTASRIRVNSSFANQGGFSMTPCVKTDNSADFILIYGCDFGGITGVTSSGTGANITSTANLA